MSAKRRHSLKDSLLHDHCTNEILDEIRSGRLPPGQRLSELAMARKLKMGRSAVRVAFDRLAWAGLLERIPRSGTYVRELTLKEYDDLMQVRARLEGLAASLACLRLTNPDLERLDTVANRLDELGAEVDENRNGDQMSLDRDYAELQELESEFHGGIARSSDNHYIVEILNRYQMLERAFLMGMSFPAEGSSKVTDVPQHREIIKALRARSPELAEEKVRRHFQLTEQKVLANLGSAVTLGSGKASHA